MKMAASTEEVNPSSDDNQIQKPRHRSRKQDRKGGHSPTPRKGYAVNAFLHKGSNKSFLRRQNQKKKPTKFVGFFFWNVTAFRSA